MFDVVMLCGDFMLFLDIVDRQTDRRMDICTSRVAFATEKNSFLCGGVTLYCAVPYCTKLYSTAAKFGLKFFFAFLDELGHIH